MPNAFKQKLSIGEPQIGLWLALVSPYSAELCGTQRYDWFVIDAEHAPNDTHTVLGQLQALSRFASEAIVRVPVLDVDMTKKVLDAGCRTVLAPMIETPEQAQAMVDAMYYPPLGKRGVGAALARASDFGASKDYLANANSDTCLIVQVETVAGVKALAKIAKVPGVDAIFIGTADLAADMGHLGHVAHEDVVSLSAAAFDQLKDMNVPSGALTSDIETAQAYLRRGVGFVGVGNDVTLLREAAANRFAAFETQLRRRT